MFYACIACSFLTLVSVQSVGPFGLQHLLFWFSFETQWIWLREFNFILNTKHLQWFWWICKIYRLEYKSIENQWMQSNFKTVNTRYIWLALFLPRFQCLFECMTQLEIIPMQPSEYILIRWKTEMSNKLVSTQTDF